MFAACDASSEPGAIRHPAADRYINQGIAAREIPKPDEYYQLPDSLGLLVTVGRATGTVEHVLGRVADAVVTDDEILILDDRFSTLRAFSATGEPLYSIGRAGAGPTDLQDPVALIGTGRDGKLAVVDRTNQRVVSLVKDPEGRWAIGDSETMTAVLPFDGCATSDRSFLLAAAVGDFEILQEVGAGEVPVHRFGQFYDTPNRILRTMLSLGQLECAVGQELLIYAPLYFPEVRAYEHGGALRWRTRFADYSGFHLDEFPDGQIVTVPPPDPTLANQTFGLAAGGGIIVVQVGNVTPASVEERRFYTDLRTRSRHGRCGGANTNGKVTSEPKAQLLITQSRAS